MNDNHPIITDAIIDHDSKVNPNGIAIYPLTIRRYALLEKIESPFINGETKFNVNSVIPSAYVMCSDNDTLKKYSSSSIDVLRNDAFDWSENLEVNDIPDMMDAIIKQLETLNKVAPSTAASSSTTSKNAKKKS